MEAFIKYLDEIEFKKNPKHVEVYMKDIATSKENDRLSSHYIVIKPEGQIVPHTHEVLEVFFIIGGEGSALVNGERTAIKGGTVIIAPPGSEHGLINTGNKDLVLYAVFSPGTV